MYELLEAHTENETKKELETVRGERGNFSSLMEYKGSDINPIALFKERFILFVKSKFTVTQIHSFATFLTPRYRSSKFAEKILSEKMLPELKYHMEIVPEKDEEVAKRY